MSNKQKSPAIKTSQPDEQAKLDAKLKYASPGTVLYVPHWTERIKILFGRNVLFKALVQMQHNPGHMRWDYAFDLTKAKTIKSSKPEEVGNN